jgi:hypothetical protein
LQAIGAQCCSRGTWVLNLSILAPSCLARLGKRFDVFAIPPGNANLTGVYSFRLAMNLGSSDFIGALGRTKKPMALIAGSNDDQFYADHYAPTLQPAKPDLTVELVPGLDHVDMLVKAAALATLRRTFDAMTRQSEKHAGLSFHMLPCLQRSIFPETTYRQSDRDASPNHVKRLNAP